MELSPEAYLGAVSVVGTIGRPSEMEAALSFAKTYQRPPVSNLETVRHPSGSSQVPQRPRPVRYRVNSE